MVLYATPKSKQTLETQQLSNLFEAIKELDSGQSGEIDPELGSPISTDKILEILPDFTQKLKKTTLKVEEEWKIFSTETRNKYKNFVDSLKIIESDEHELNRQKLQLIQLISIDNQETVEEFFNALKQFIEVVSKALDRDNVLKNSSMTTEPKQSKAFQAYLASKAQRIEVYRRLADS